MGMTEYDNVAKWATFFRRLPPLFKVCSVVAATGAIAIWIYIQIGIVRKLNAENQALKANIEQAKSDLMALIDRKNELYAENLRLKELLMNFS